MEELSFRALVNDIRTYVRLCNVPKMVFYCERERERDKEHTKFLENFFILKQNFQDSRKYTFLEHSKD